MSRALSAFQVKLEDVDRLLHIHEQLTGTGAGRRGPEADVLNRSAMVLGIGAWEAYVEDLLLEAIEFLLRKAKSHEAFADGLKVRVSEFLTQKGSGSKPLSYWNLADDGYRKLLREEAEGLIEAFHTPSTQNVNGLFKKALGCKDVIASSNKAGTTLAECLVKRHEIAHGRTAAGVKKGEVRKFRRTLEDLSRVVDEHVADHVETTLRAEEALHQKRRAKRRGPKPKAKSKRGRPRKLRPW